VWVYLIGGLFLADFVFYGYLPSQRRLQSLRDSRNEQERMIRMAVDQSAELPKLKVRLRNVEEIVGHYDSYVPEERFLGVFLQEIADIMTRHQLTDQVVVPQSEIACGEVNCIPIHVNCKGSLNNVFSFFHDVQTMSRLVRIEKADLQNDADYSGQVSMHIEAMIYYRSETQRNAEIAVSALQKAVTNDS
jgi:Tfp pilus assembly protein PilO